MTSYDVTGPAGAPVILFLHGARMTRKMWLPQMETLAGECRVIALDLPGHGARAEIRFEMEAAVREIAEALDAATSGRALVVGSSLGDYASLEFAARCPDKVAGLVLAGCTLNIRGMAGLPFRAGVRLLRRLKGPWLTRTHEKLCRRLFPASIAEPIIEAGFYFDAVPDALNELLGQDFLPLLRAFPGPVLFLNGRRDLVFRGNEAAFVAACPNARLQVIRRTGHRCSLERPRDFTGAVRGFARSLSWETPGAAPGPASG
jgi:pimeloyl-ACP methyl ester carboxylesterase